IGPPDSKGSRWIELSSAHTLLRWPYTNQGTGKSGPDLAMYFIQMSDDPSVYLPATRQEYELELAHLQNYVKWKTDLPLREMRI
ncbi:MAG TPA: hypothetical protein VJO32_15985, partial [Ktedonobacteraceae bacterium]|nr:hypothetical protein [Ktedonobacteraceae bacterium]